MIIGLSSDADSIAVAFSCLAKWQLPFVYRAIFIDAQEWIFIIDEDMTWRIEHAVIQGEIDNTIPGKTRGRIWLIHQSAPIELDLLGNCRRDLAGTTLRFRNPNPDYTLKSPDLSNPQTGSVGDMTASRKLQVYQSDSDTGPTCWKNHLSLEWFDHVNGRVFIESPLFSLEISEREWSLSQQDEEIQVRRNLESMRDFMQVFLQREENTDLWSQENADEFAWEKRFRESDRLSDAFQELLEKYLDDPNCQQKIAYAMGWSEQLGDRIDAEKSESDADWERELLMEEFSDMENLDTWQKPGWDSDDHESITHPLQQKAQDCACQAMELLGEKMDGQGPEARLCSLLMLIAAKLAGALHGIDDTEEHEPGFVLAMLKRCLYWQNDAISACSEILARCDDPEEERFLLQIRQSIFETREEITEMRREFKQN